MLKFPYITDDINQIFSDEREHLDFIILRPILIVLYFFIRIFVFPFKFLFHRNSYGFEARIIDEIMAFGIKYFARTEAARIILRHVQIEPMLYKFILNLPKNEGADEFKKLNGINGDFNIESLKIACENNLTIGHDLLSYELVDKFDKDKFINELEQIKSNKPEDINCLSLAILEENKQHSLQLLGASNIVIFIVIIITLFADLNTAVKALNSFDSDAILLWCLKHIYKSDPDILIDLSFFMPESANRAHYNSSAFFSNPSQYLFYHVVFHEVAYDLLSNKKAIN